MKKVKRPWGTYEVLCSTKNYKVKRLTIYPGGKLSLQKHKYRDEYWVVFPGIEVKIGMDVMCSLGYPMHLHIISGEIHTAENKTKYNKPIIEVQFGKKLLESDIIRLDDIYGRAKNDNIV